MTVDLRPATSGSTLRSPIVASAARSTATRRRLRRLDRAAGAAAIVLPSLFEEEIIARGARAAPLARGRAPSTSPRRSTTSRPSTRSSVPPTATWRRSSGVKAGVGVPVIASLNAQHRRRLGALRASASRRPAPTRSSSTSTTSPPIPRRTGGRRWRRPTWSLIAAVRAAITHPARGQARARTTRRSRTSPAAAVAAGADGLVLFNRFYQPDLDLETLDVVPRLELSQPLGAAPADALDRDPAPAARLRASPSRRPPASTPAPTWSRRCWSAPTSR